MSPVRRWRSDRGSAVVEFVLVSVLVVALFLGLVQLALALYIRNTLTSAAGEGARFAAAADREPADGILHTQALIRETLPDTYADHVTAGHTTVAGVPTVVVEVDAQLPVLGWLGPAGSLHVVGHAMEES